MALTEYEPLEDRVVVSDCTRAPLTLVPACTRTVTELESPVSAPAVPESVGVEFVDDEGGAFSDTTGAVVSPPPPATVNVTGGL